MEKQNITINLQSLIGKLVIISTNDGDLEKQIKEASYMTKKEFLELLNDVNNLGPGGQEGEAQ